MRTLPNPLVFGLSDEESSGTVVVSHLYGRAGNPHGDFRCTHASVMRVRL